MGCRYLLQEIFLTQRWNPGLMNCRQILYHLSHREAQSIIAATHKSLQSCLTLCDPMDSSLPGSSVHGILQAGILEWRAIAFSMLYPTDVKLN